METNIINVKYEEEYVPKVFSGKTYTYYTAIKLCVGDLVIAPTVCGNKVAKVCEINISEKNVEHIKSYLKVITDKLDKIKYLKLGKICREETERIYSKVI